MKNIASMSVVFLVVFILGACASQPQAPLQPTGEPVILEKIVIPEILLEFIYTPIQIFYKGVLADVRYINLWILESGGTKVSLVVPKSKFDISEELKSITIRRFRAKARPEPFRLKISVCYGENFETNEVLSGPLVSLKQ